MKVNPFNTDIFRAYDIRGKYPREVNEKTAYFIGRAFTQFLGKKKAKIVVGRDGRFSSFALFKSLSKGIIDQGGDVIDIGLSTSPMLYFATAFYKYDGGIEITASHNPAQYNGFKIVREKAVPIGERNGLKQIKRIFRRLQETNLVDKTKRKGKFRRKNVIGDYVKFNLKPVREFELKSFRIVIDTANAVSGILIPRFFKSSKSKIYHIFSKLDGNFSNHSPNPLIKRNLKALRQEVKKRKADLGVAFDGDGDRIIFIDEKGEIIPSNLITVLISKIILEKRAGQKILYDVPSSRIVKESIKRFGGVPVLSRVGHSFIKEKMRQENIVFAGESSGHYYSKSHYFCEAPFFVLFKVLEAMSKPPYLSIIGGGGKQKNKLSDLVKPYKLYFHSGEINFRTKDKKKILEKIAGKYKRGKISHLDGIRVDFPDWWFLIRPSNTEPLLRLVIEAKTKNLMEEKKKEIKKAIIKR